VCVCVCVPARTHVCVHACVCACMCEYAHARVFISYTCACARRGGAWTHISGGSTRIGHAGKGASRPRPQRLVVVILLCACCIHVNEQYSVGRAQARTTPTHDPLGKAAGRPLGGCPPQACSAPAGLPHHPAGRPVDRLSPGCTHQQRLRGVCARSRAHHDSATRAIAAAPAAPGTGARRPLLGRARQALGLHHVGTALLGA
jgi:hypothetical protein